MTTISRLRALILLNQCTGIDIWAPETCREAQIRFLCEKLADPTVREIVRAHVPRALGCLLRGGDDPQKEIVAETMLRSRIRPGHDR